MCHVETNAIHGVYTAADHAHAAVPPIYLSAAFHMESAEHGDALSAGTQDGFSYSRVANPTVDVLERRLAALEGGRSAVAVASGMAAVSFALLCAAEGGGRIIAPKTLYGASVDAMVSFFPQFGVHTDFVRDINDLAEVEALIGPDTRAIFAESVANPSTEVTDVGSTATMRIDGRDLTVVLQIPGQHMVLNGAAALLAAHLAGGDLDRLAEGLSDFNGVRRRFEYRGTAGGVRVFDDYAHHPTEVTAVLQAARQKVEAEGEGARVIVAFQPHLYSRTIEFAEEFAAALSLADAAVVLDIFGAREKPVEGVSSRIITDAMTTEVVYEPDFSHAPQTVRELARPGDLVLTMGAGDVTLLAGEILSALDQ